MEHTIGLRIRVARDAAGLTQEALATAVGTTAEVIGTYERDKVTPSRERVAEIAQATQVDASWIDYGVGTGPDVSEDPRSRVIGGGR